MKRKTYREAICYPRGLPRIMWPEKRNEIILQFLLAECEKEIKQYENKILEELERELSGI